MRSVLRSYSAHSRFFPFYSETELQRRIYNIEAFHHYSPSFSTPMFKLLYSSSMLLKDLKEAEKAREKAYKEAQARAAQIAASYRRRPRFVMRKK